MYCFCTYKEIEPDVKAHAESILSALGIPVSNTINMFFKQIILHKGIPFDLILLTVADNKTLLRHFSGQNGNKKAPGQPRRP